MPQPDPPRRTGQTKCVLSVMPCLSNLTGLFCLTRPLPMSRLGRITVRHSVTCRSRTDSRQTLIGQ